MFLEGQSTCKAALCECDKRFITCAAHTIKPTASLPCNGYVEHVALSQRATIFPLWIRYVYLKMQRNLV
uniref:Phospholipase A(2) n=1 Tax=Ascaris lumbricoides TaxID=6252 RepID=A0A0M3I791_ASCLU